MRFQLQSTKEPAPMPGDFSVSTEDKQPVDIKDIKIALPEVNTTETVIEEIALLGFVDALPDLNQDEKAWTTLQSILHPQPSEIEIDEDFLCPITQSLIRDPVATCDGQMYEREAIEQWFSKGNTTSPNTNKPLKNTQLTPNVFAKKQINSLVEKNSTLKDSEEWYLPQSWIVELQAACKTGDEKQIKRLASRDRRLLVHAFKDQYGGQTALHFATAGNPKALEVMIELLENRQRGLALAGLLQADREGRLPFHQALLAKQDAQTLIKLMTQMGRQIAQIQPLPGGWSPGFDRRALNEALAWCVGQEDEDKIRCLLRLGADPQAKTAQGETRVYQAVKKGCARSLNVLLECKADPNLEDKRLDDSPLHAAVRRGDAGMVTALLKAGIKTNRVLNNGRTPLHLAAEQNGPEMLVALADAKTLPTDLREAADAEGCTPLHRAVTEGSLSTVTWLLDHGAHLQAVNAKGQTPLHLAAGANRTDIISLFLERKASLSAIDHQGNTALHTAAEAGANQAVVALLKAGAASGLKNKARQTAQQLAESQNHTDTVKELNQTVAELQVAEEKELKNHGVLGIFLWKQQQIIRDQQAQIEVQQVEIKNLQAQIKTQQEVLGQLVEQEKKEANTRKDATQSISQELKIHEVNLNQLSQENKKIKEVIKQQEEKEKILSKLSLVVGNGVRWDSGYYFEGRGDIVPRDSLSKNVAELMNKLKK